MFIAAIVASAALSCPSGTSCSHDTATQQTHCSHGLISSSHEAAAQQNACSHGTAADCGACMEPPAATIEWIPAGFVGPVVTGSVVHTHDCGHEGCFELPGGALACRPYNGEPIPGPVNVEWSGLYRENILKTANVGTPRAGGSRVPEVPLYFTRENAPVVIFLDFDGHRETNRAWTTFFGPITTPRFDLDGNPSDYSDFEIRRIEDIILHMFEDFAPFNVNITTVPPGSGDDDDDGYGEGVRWVRVAFGGDGRWLGGGASGVALRNSFDIHQGDATVYVFTDVYGPIPNLAKAAADTASHEVGHAVGLFHQSLFEQFDGEWFVIEYHPGDTVWAPIMGGGFTQQLVTWHNGTFFQGGPFSVQDDIGIFTDEPFSFGYIEDDHPNNAGGATALPLEGDNREFRGTGIIEDLEDQDYFRIRIPSGNLTLRVDGAFPSQNLDVRVRMFGNSRSYTFDPSTSINVSEFIRNLPGGNYNIVVESNGEYGRVGQYVISGFHQPGPGVVNACSADLNGDGVVDLLDLVSIFGNYGNSGTGDLNNDGKVDLNDVLTLLSAWGTECPVEDDEL